MSLCKNGTISNMTTTSPRVRQYKKQEPDKINTTISVHGPNV